MKHMFEKFKNVGDQNILVIGDIILDKYIYGDSTRISPEAPVPIVEVKKHTNVLGGAANVAANLTTLGAKVFLIGCVGNDSDGDLVLDKVKKQIHDHSGIFRTNKITTVKTRIVSKGQQMLRIDHEDNTPLKTSEEGLLVEKISNTIIDQNISGVVLQDYNKGLFTSSLISQITTITNQHRLPFFVDPKHDNFWEFQGAALFKPNWSEIKLANLSNSELSFDELLLQTASKLKCEILMCTLAEEGIAFVKEDKVCRTPTQKIDVLDVSGAGDTALSIMVLGYLLGYDADAISVLANLCGKIVCLKSGVSTITFQELKEAYHSKEEDILE